MKRMLSVVLVIAVFLSMMVFNVNTFAAIDAYSTIQAESFTSQSGVTIATCSEGGQQIGSTSTGDYVVYNGIDFGTGPTSVDVRLATAVTGGKIEFRLDSLTGTLVGTLSARDTGSWSTWATQTCTISGATGVHNLYLSFIGSNGENVANINWFVFKGGSAPTPTPVTTDAYSTVQAESFTSQSGVTVSTCSEGGQQIGSTSTGDYVVYNSIDFGTGPTSVDVRLATAVTGGKIEFRLDSLTGTLIGTLSARDTGSWSTWATQSCSISGATGLHNLYLSFIGSNGENVANINWYVFKAGTGSTPTPTPTPAPTPTPTIPPSSGDRYITSTGAGTKDGTSWSNAFAGNTANGLQVAWDATGSTSTLYVGSGAYNVKQKLTIASGGTSTSAPKRLVGVNTGTGLPVFTGDFTRANQVTGNFIDVSSGASYWVIKDIKIKNYYNGVYVRGKNVGYRIYNVDITEMSDGLYLYGGATATDAIVGSHDIIIEDCDFLYYTKRGIRFRDGNYNVTVNRCTADAGGAAYWVSTNFPFSYQVADSGQDPSIIDHDIIFNDCEGRNNYHNNGTTGYWNGDTFCAERASDNITYNRCKAFDNTDGGWDVKTKNTYLNDCVAFGNKRAFRFWSIGEAVMRNCVGAYSVEPGGMTSACGVWAGSNAIVKIYNSTIYNNSGAELRIEGGNISCFDSILADDQTTGNLYSVIDGGSKTITNCDEYIAGVQGQNPQFVNGSNSSWNGVGTDFNSRYYGSSKGYYQ